MDWLAWMAMAQAAAVQPYFPPAYERMMVRCDDLGHSLPRFDNFRRQWYSAPLLAAGEPSLFVRARKGEGDALRFVWLPSFDPQIIVRVEGLSGRSPRLIAVALDMGVDQPMKVLRRLDRTLSPAEAADLRRRLVAANPLTLPAASDPCDFGCDGSEWIIERLAGHRYKMVSQWSPEHGPVRAAGMAMLRLTGWAIHPY